MSEASALPAMVVLPGGVVIVQASGKQEFWPVTRAVYRDIS